VYQELRGLLADELGLDPSPQLQALEQRVLRQDEDLDWSAPVPRTLPSGIVTFLFSDIEGSTRLFQRLGERYPPVLEEHNALLRAAFTAHGGVEVRTIGDAFFVAFDNAVSALGACADAQLALASHPWPAGNSIRVRMGLHTAPSAPAGDDYIALAVHQAARVADAAHGGQVICTAATAEEVGGTPVGGTLLLLGEYHLKDFDDPVPILQFTHPDLSQQFPPLRAPLTATHNLPRQRASFVGRTQELGELAKLLDQSSLVTIVGPGGVGKTRLSLEAGAESTGAFPEGVWFAELASLADPALIASHVALALGVRQQRGQPLEEAIADFVADGRVLLIVDNCEHVIDDAARFVDDLLGRAAELTVLATSREPLRIAGEQVYRIDSLATPDSAELASDALLDFDAVRLFVARATLADRRFELTPDSIATVAAITRRLDGIPLAIELAAARVGELSLGELLTRLEHRFEVLDSGLRTALPRQQTLRALVDWSHDLLSTEAQTLLRRLAVFAGGCSLDAATRVCSDAALGESDVGPTLFALVDRSLLVPRDHHDATRYSMLETIREYAIERLVAAEEESLLRSRHAAWSLDLAERAAPELTGPEQAAWLEILSSEHDNLGAAFDWGISAAPRQKAAARVAAALWRYWLIRGHLEEGMRRIKTALAAEDGRWPLVRVQLLLGLAQIAQPHTRWPDVESALDEGIPLARSLGNKRWLAELLGAHGFSRAPHDDYAGARASYEEAIELSLELDDPEMIGRMRSGLAEAALLYGDLAVARERFEEAIPTLRSARNPSGLARALMEAGRVARLQGDFAAARTELEEALTLATDMGYEWVRCVAMGNLGYVGMYEDRLADARRLMDESLAVARRLGDQISVSFGTFPLGYLAEVTGDDASARLLYDESLATARTVGFPFPHLLGQILNHQAALALREGRIDEAKNASAEALAITDGREPYGFAAAKRRMAEIAMHEGDLDAARSLLDASVTISRSVKDQLGVLEALELLVRAAVAASEWRVAAGLLGRADGLREEIGASLFPRARSERDAVIKELTAQLGREALKDNTLAGRRAPLDDVLSRDEPSST
jgi:predicted ATPase/class 3 adenylate cyclase